MENLNRPILRKWSGNQNLPTKKSPGSEVSLVNSTKYLKMTIPKLFQKLKKREHFQTHFMRTALNWCRSQIRTLQENHRIMYLMNTDSEILNKILANQIQKYIKTIIHYNQVEFFPGIQGWFNIHKSIGWYVT